jgi:beta-phosphoglucomutase
MTAFPRCLVAVLFDLDGVLTDTAHAHFVAWKRLADQLGIDFDETVNEALKGVDRMGSLDLILAHGGVTLSEVERRALADRKNGWYVEAIAAFSPADLFPGARDALEHVRAAGLGTALVSASRNAPALIGRMGIAEMFDTVIDPASVARGKPAPDLFLAAAAALEVDPAACLGVEDAPAGIVAIHAAGMMALGVGTAAALPEADAIIAAIGDFRLKDYHAC